VSTSSAERCVPATTTVTSMMQKMISATFVRFDLESRMMV